MSSVGCDMDEGACLNNRSLNGEECLIDFSSSEADTQPLPENDQKSDLGDNTDFTKHLTSVAQAQEKPKIYFTRLHADAIMPQKFYQCDAGIDFSMPRTMEVFPGKVTRVETGIAVDVPLNSYGRLVERSCIAAKGMSVGGGVIDCGYRGEVIICLTYIKKIIQVL